MNRRASRPGLSASRRGVSLLELLAVMTACGVIVSVGVGLVHRALRLESASRDLLERERTALVLGRRFRLDVRSATQASVSAIATTGDTVVELRYPAGERVAYVIRDGLLERLAERAGRDTRESFAVRPGTRWTASREGRLVTLAGRSDEPVGTGPQTDIELVARLGTLALEAVP